MARDEMAAAIGETGIARLDARPQRRRKFRAGSFMAVRRQHFLDALAYTCNVSLAAEYAGVDHATPYYHRARDPVFAQQWRDALAAGYDRIEELVLQHGGAGRPLDPADPGAVDDSAMPPFDFDRALRVLGEYRRTRAGEPSRRDGFRGITATREETNAALLKAIASAQKRLANRTPAA